MEKTYWVLPRTLPLQWYEAVALVCAVADAIEHGRLKAVPQIGELALASDGSVHAADGTFGTALGRFPAEAAVVELRRLLADLLDTGAPPELKRFSAESDGASSIADFRQALGFFERPSKEKDLRALAARIAEADDKARLQAELDRLTREARKVPQPPEKTPPAGIVRVAPLWRTVFTAVAIGVVLAAAVAIVIVITHGSGPAALASDAQAGDKRGLVERLRDTVRSTLETLSPEKTDAPTAPATAVNDRRSGHHGTGHVGTRTVESAASAFETPSLVKPAPPELPSFRMWAPDVIVEATRESPTVYDQNSSGVIPATLLRPHLPAVNVAGALRTRLGRVRIVINEQGRVERVRLLTTSAERRYYDAMILAAIKAWIFRPATRAGQPVRYRIELPLT